MNARRVVALAEGAGFAIDPEGKITAWNAAAEGRLGYARSAVVGRRCWKLLEGRDLRCDRICDGSCPFIKLQSRQVDRALRSFRLLDRSCLSFRDAAGEDTRADVSTVLVAEAGKQEIVHLF